jgi:hypothetical protein
LPVGGEKKILCLRSQGPNQEQEHYLSITTTLIGVISWWRFSTTIKFIVISRWWIYSSFKDSKPDISISLSKRSFQKNSTCNGGSEMYFGTIPKRPSKGAVFCSPRLPEDLNSRFLDTTILFWRAVHRRHLENKFSLSCNRYKKFD